MTIVVIEHMDGSREALRVEYLKEKEHELFIAYNQGERFISRHIPKRNIGYKIFHPIEN